MSQTQAPAQNDATYVLEQDQRLSRSLLWQLQRSFFDGQGPNAWQQGGGVPHYITTNPYIAQAYARVTLGWLRDCRNVAPASASGGFAALDVTQPIYIVELGAGPGRFGHSYLKRLLELLARSSLKGLSIQYVMTDVAESNVAYWSTHPSLQPFVDAGQLDFARFDAGSDQEIRLKHSGVVLAPGTVKNPLVAIANYCFDCLPQDVFEVKAGALYESLVTLRSPQPEPDRHDPQLLSRLQTSYEHVLTTAEYYDDPDLNRILRGYQERLPDTTLLFPYTALQTLRALDRLAGGRLLLLSGDKGYSREEDLVGWATPEIVLHGDCFSMMVNYHALGQYVLDRGGHFLQSTYRHSSLNICAFLTGAHPDGYVETHLAYDEAIERGNPDDFFCLKAAIDEHLDDLTVEQILAYLRLSGWDPRLMWDCLPLLIKRVEDVPEAVSQELHLAIVQVWETFYPIGAQADLAIGLATLLHHLGYYPEALEYLEQSRQLFGPDPGVLYDMAYCHYMLGNLDDALRAADQALELQPTFEAARAMRLEIQAARGRRRLARR
jgi:tetratricopeptide (TPR) repeat protein